MSEFKGADMSDTREAELHRAAVEVAKGLMEDMRAKGTPIDGQLETVVTGLVSAQMGLVAVKHKIGHLEESTRLINDVVRDVSRLAMESKRDVSRLAVAPKGSPSEQAKGALLAQSEAALAEAKGHLGAITKQADPAVGTAVSALESAVVLLQEQLRHLALKQWQHDVERDQYGQIARVYSIPVYPT